MSGCYRHDFIFQAILTVVIRLLGWYLERNQGKVLSNSLLRYVAFSWQGTAGTHDKAILCIYKLSVHH